MKHLVMSLPRNVFLERKKLYSNLHCPEIDILFRFIILFAMARDL